MISEQSNYLERIEDLRGQVTDLIVRLPAQALNWRPIPGKEDHSSNSLAILAAHIAGAEHFWIGEVIGGKAETRNRDAEFATQAANPAELIHLLEKTAQETKEVFCTLNDSDMNGARQVKDRVIAVRWCIVHVIDHTALHLGHMQITYQLWSGGKSATTPLWTERLPKG